MFLNVREIFEDRLEYNVDLVEKAKRAGQSEHVPTLPVRHIKAIYLFLCL